MAFGNPDISANPIDDMFRSQADTYGNSFSNPVNYGNMNPGWGVDPSLMTPGYTAGFRPQYGGPNSSGDYGRPGFFGAVNNMFNPMTRDPMWGNPFMHNQQNYDAIGSRPADAAMWGIQRVAAPAAAYWGAGRMMGGMNSFGMAKGAYNAGRTFGRGIGVGMAKSFGFRGLGTSMLARPMGMLAGATAGFALPYLGMQAAMSGLERGVFNPYMNTRRTAGDLQSNFSGVSFGDSIGHPITGGGLGGYESARIAGQITGQGINDMSFSTGQYADGASMVMRSGMMDNVSSTSQISGKVKSAMEQVKMIMAIAAMPEMRDAVEQLSKLNRMGANINGGMHSVASTTMMQLGGYAKVAGTSVQRMMNTVGAQGEYLYQANGMTGYLGQLAAANSFSSFAAGNRMGLLSPSQLSRMGGLEGATQSSLTGQINVAQSLYSKIGNYNSYLGGGRGSSAVDNITQFSSQVAGDPLAASGALGRFGRRMGGIRMAERGSLATEDDLMHYAGATNQLGKNGKLDANRAFSMLTGVMGMSPDEAEAFLTQREMQTNSSVHSQTIKGLRTNEIEQQHQYLSSRGLYGGIVGTPIYATTKLFNKLTDGASQILSRPLARGVGSVSDYAAKAHQYLMYGDSTHTGDPGDVQRALGLTGSVSDMANDQIFGDTNYMETDGFWSSKYKNQDDHEDVVQRLNELYLKGDPKAQAYYKTSDPTKKRKILNDLIRSNALGEDAAKTYTDASSSNELNSYLSSRKLVNAQDTSAYSNFSRKQSGDEVGQIKDLDRITGLTNAGVSKNFRVMALAGNLLLKQASGKLNGLSDDDDLLKDEDMKSFMTQTGETDPRAALQRAEQITRGAQASGKMLNAFNSARIKDDEFFDKGLEAKYKAAAGNPELQQRILMADRSSRFGLSASGDKAAMSHSVEEVAGSVEQSKQTVVQGARSDAALKSDRLDFSNAKSMRDTLDRQEQSATTMLDAAKIFERAVLKATGGKASDTAPSIFSSEGWGNFKNSIGNQKRSDRAAGNG
jgi:hypothetical protein